MSTPTHARDYATLASRLAAAPLPQDHHARMAAVIDALWDALAPTGVTWIGFYHAGNGEMSLGARRDKPACSPIGLHGACGRAFLTRTAIVVRDVASLGENYVACDPRDKSEVVVPVFDDQGTCVAVLDADSHEVAAFNESDARGLQHILEATGLSAPPPTRTVDII